MSFLGKKGFLFSSWLDSGSLIEWLVGYKVLKAENTVLVCRCVQTSSLVIQRTLLYSRKIHILVPFYVVSHLIYIQNIINWVPAGTIFRTMNCLEVKRPWNHSIQGTRDLICCYWSSGERVYSRGWWEEFLCWAFVWGREGGWLGPDSWVCDLQTLRALCYDIHSIAILKFLTSFEPGTPHLHKALQILYLLLCTGFGATYTWVRVLIFSCYWLPQFLYL